ncbi:radical SAM/SPASM domain-containing protein [uncultured Clostridium sp.]|uniref:radical SAM/SPASM domain-containing protein n=1 Tax=uncultured Clostridium sp. TaxID=59620 RepID=UPI003217D45F
MGFDLSNYKFSKYNHKIFLNKDIYLYNAFTGGFGKVDEKNKELAIKYDFTGSVIEADLVQDNKFLNSLLEGGFLVYKDIDEYNMLLAASDISRYNNQSMSLTLVPTLSCNFRCVYCFEKDKCYPNQHMTPEVIDATVKFIDDSLKNDSNLSITWFGGEPLVRFDILKELQLKINELSKKKNLNVYSSIITNGYLLNKKTSDELVELGITFVQVTIDGDKHTHDERRMLHDGNGTYDRIIQNLLESNDKLDIALRVNINKDNSDCMDSFLESLKKTGISDKKNIKTYFSVVRDYDTSKSCLNETCYTTKEYAQEEMKLYRLAQEKSIPISISINPQVSVCAAVSPNSYIIEPDGSLQKCWNLVGDPDKCVGNILKNKSERYLSNQIKWYSWRINEKEKCKNCSILPLCMGGCPYFDVYNHEIYEKSEYSCNSLKYNLDDILKLIAYRYLNEAK